MTLRSLHKTVKIVAILLWIIAILILAIAIINHQFWSLMPIIAYNYVQNYLGWIIVTAFALTICGLILKIFLENR